MPWPFTTAPAPTLNSTVTLSNVPGAVITTFPEWWLGIRVVNNSGAVAKINITDTAGSPIGGTDYELQPGQSYVELLNVEPMVGVKAWCDQAAGVTFKRWGWT